MQAPANQKIVVAEDDAALRHLLVCQLEAAGYTVTACENGRQALDGICAMGSGIVLADWMMPVMDGLELCAAVHELQSLQVLKHIYFILLTAQTSKDIVVRGLEAGANDCVTKPYHEGELRARIAVGERLLRLQDELWLRSVEVQKANAQMAVLAQRLETLANTDGLTGIANRRHLLERCAELWTQAERQDTSLTCLMLDVDRFKRINDTYGHKAGDRVLREICDRVRHALGRSLPFGRFGGEEFLVACPETPLAEARALAERIRQRIAEHPVLTEDGEIAVTISCGVAERLPAHRNIEELIAQADAMLYRAKQNGRNRVCTPGDDDAPPRPAPPAPATTGRVPTNLPTAVEAAR